MRRFELAKKLAKETKFGLEKAEKIISAFSEVAADALMKGDKIVYSNFGTFKVHNYPSKVITHPKLGKAKKLIMLPTNVIKWSPSDNVRILVAGSHRSKIEKVDNLEHLPESDRAVEIKVKREDYTLEKVEDQPNLTLSKEKEISANTTPASRILASLIRKGLREKASDIFIEPSDKGTSVRLRIDGAIQPNFLLPHTLNHEIGKELRRLSALDENAFEGEFQLNIDSEKTDFFFSILPLAHGDKILLKVVNHETIRPLSSQPELQKNDLEIIRGSTLSAAKIILLISHDNESAKVVFYHLAQELYSEGQNIITIEGSIQKKIAGITQSQVYKPNLDTKTLFSITLKHEPDVIFIDNIEDRETAEMIFAATSKGQKVIAGIDAKDLSDALNKMANWGISPKEISRSIDLAICQQVLSKVCPKCREKYSPDKEQIEKLNQVYRSMSQSDKDYLKSLKVNFQKGKGCDECNETGNKGYLINPEIITFNHEINRADNIFNISGKSKRTLIESAILKAAEGQVSLEEALERKI